MLHDGWRGLSALFAGFQLGLLNSLLVFGVLFVLRVVLRNTRVAMIGTTLFAIVISMGCENVMLETPGAVLTGLAIVLCLSRSAPRTAPQCGLDAGSPKT